ncbi:hypothetical protein HGP29_22670 [Flammeovirga sp. SR4]|uniref:Uncharacterized protein n=2 Tax=Flammeovirga agarivorans TaxID=2726742 RepID=A0A7X8XYD5_9BACT|nr:hypothetical protein [Flammeovirga agarivorans]
MKKILTPLVLFIFTSLSILTMSFHFIGEVEAEPANSTEPNQEVVKAKEVVEQLNQRLQDNQQENIKCVFKDGDIMFETATEILCTFPYDQGNKYVTGFDKHRKLKYLYVVKNDGSQKIIDFHKFM